LKKDSLEKSSFYFYHFGLLRALRMGLKMPFKKGLTTFAYSISITKTYFSETFLLSIFISTSAATPKTPKRHKIKPVCRTGIIKEKKIFKFLILRD